MTVIVDGYNLLHASGVFGEERGARGFEQFLMLPRHLMACRDG